MDSRERYFDLQEIILSAIDAHQSGVWTALVCTVVSYNPTNNPPTIVAQPTAMGIQMNQNGTASNVQLPVLPDVPVCFPRGGNCTLTFPIQEGDECLVVFSSRQIDNWFQGGGVQPITDLRKHDLSDGLAIFGPFSRPTSITGISTTTAQFRSNDGQTVVEIDADNGNVNLSTFKQINLNANGSPSTAKINMNSVGQLHVIAPTVIVQASTSTTITSPTVTINGNLQVNGNIALTGTASGGGGTINVSGAIAATGDITANGTSVHTHEHSGVTSGSDTSGPPV